MIAAVAALRFPTDHRHVPPPGLLEALAAALVDHDDVDAVTCIGLTARASRHSVCKAVPVCSARRTRAFLSSPDRR